MQAALEGQISSTANEIPVPPPQESGVDYGSLYSRQYKRPTQYLRFSETVEEVTGCPYNMTSADAVFLKAFNAKQPQQPQQQQKGAQGSIPAPQSSQLSEDDFESIMAVFEETAAVHAPYASVDNTVVPYDVMYQELQLQIKEQRVLKVAQELYAYWKSQRQESGNRPLHPTLKFETHQDQDDGDPYVCFRRREARQTRKTRTRDNQIPEKFKRLRRELEEGRFLVESSHNRELLKKELLKADRKVFETRARLKSMMIRLKITDDDGLLINSVPKVSDAPYAWCSSGMRLLTCLQKRKVSEANAAARQPQSQQRASLQGAKQTMSAEVQELTTMLETWMARTAELRRDIANKMETHRKWNDNHVDLTDKPMMPPPSNPGITFRAARVQFEYLPTPPASAAGDSPSEPAGSPASPDKAANVTPPADEDRMDLDETLKAAQNRSTPAQPEVLGQRRPPTPPPELPQPLEGPDPRFFRRRVGRLGVVYLDRAPIKPPDLSHLDERIRSRWKFDADDDEELADVDGLGRPVWQVDPYDTRALKFRATIPPSPHLYHHPSRQRVPVHDGVAHPNAASSSHGSQQRLAAPAASLSAPKLPPPQGGSVKQQAA